MRLMTFIGEWWNHSRVESMTSVSHVTNNCYVILCNHTTKSNLCHSVYFFAHWMIIIGVFIESMSKSFNWPMAFWPCSRGLKLVQLSSLHDNVLIWDWPRKFCSGALLCWWAAMWEFSDIQERISCNCWLVWGHALSGWLVWVRVL